MRGGPADLIDVALEVAEILEALGVPYFLAGSMASSFHGEPRSTLDADIVADLEPVHVRPFLGALGTSFYVDAETVAAAVERREEFNLIKKRAALKVDIFVPQRDLWLEEQMAGRRRRRLRLEPPGEAFVASAEDTVLHKLKWYAEGGRVSDRQWRDVLGVLKAQGGRLGLQVMKERARRLGLEALLDQALGQAAQGELRGGPPPGGGR